MANSKAILNEIKKDFAKARLKDRPAKAKQLIDELAEDIQKQLNGGATLAEVYEIIRARLPAEIKLTVGSFRKYWTDSRKSVRFLGITNRVRRNSSETTSFSKERSQNIKMAQPKNVAPFKTADQFRKDPDNI
jgi:vancomycin resistance protein YoaR